MSDALDLFDDDPPPAHIPPHNPGAETGKAPFIDFSKADGAAAARRDAARAESMSAPCQRPRPFNGGHVCRVGGGDACFSDDGGRSWFCRPHRPHGFLPGDRL